MGPGSFAAGGAAVSASGYSTTTGGWPWVRPGEVITVEHLTQIGECAKLAIVSALATYGMVVLGCEEELACSVAEHMVRDDPSLPYQALLERYREEIGAVPL